MQLKDLKTGDKAIITGIKAGEKIYRAKLLAMGLLPGTEFVVIRVAPLGDPIEIKIRGFALSLRKNEAKLLQIVSCPGLL